MLVPLLPACPPRSCPVPCGQTDMSSWPGSTGLKHPGGFWGLSGLRARAPLLPQSPCPDHSTCFPLANKTQVPASSFWHASGPSAECEELGGTLAAQGDGFVITRRRPRMQREGALLRALTAPVLLGCPPAICRIPHPEASGAACARRCVQLPSRTTGRARPEGRHLPAGSPLHPWVTSCRKPCVSAQARIGGNQELAGPVCVRVFIFFY